jgi:4-hydroxy-3-polyprenylbenzoate decarboxylase
MYRDNPILTGAPPLRPTTSLFGIPMTAVQVWEQLERSGVTDVQGVWCFCHSLMIVISLRQRYAGHAQQALLSATGLRTGASMYRYVVVVDEDIDPTNLPEVTWAICTRVDPETSIEILKGTWTSDLDPRLPPEKRKRGDHTIGRALINACKPFDWRDQFPPSNVFGPEMRKRVREKWTSILK